MLSAVLEVSPTTEPADLAATLTSLVVGAVEGVLRDVAVLDAGMTPQAREVAEQAGCDLFKAGDALVACASRRGDWVLLLEPGARPLPGWVEHLVAVLPPQVHDDAPPRYRFGRADGSDRGWRRFLPASGRRPLESGLVVRRTALQAALAGQKGLAAAVAGGRIQRLEAKLMPAARR